MLSVCIVNFNTCSDLDKCLNSILNSESSITFEVIVVDNASQDGSVEMVRNKYPWVHLIINTVNRGFAAANNQALIASCGRYMLLLNPDTIVHPGALDSLVQFMDAHPDAGGIGPKLLNADGSLQYSCRAFPTLIAGMFRNTPLDRLFPSNRFSREYLLADHDHNEPMEVDWVSGAAMMVRREVLQTVGMLDEDYFMYCEDMDWCWRMRQVGWKVYYVPTAVITHTIGRSSDQVLVPVLYHRHRSMLRFYLKNYRRRYPLIFAPLIILGIGLRLGGALTYVAYQRFSHKWRQLILHAKTPNDKKENQSANRC